MSLHPQTTTEVLIVKPWHFISNPDTQPDNKFQKSTGPDKIVIEQALSEFENFRDCLELAGVKVNVLDDNFGDHTPDSIFPNNWFSTHNDFIILYPMKPNNRRLERKLRSVFPEHLKKLPVVDLTHLEAHGHFLEGTGSMVIDHDSGMCFSAISERTVPEALNSFEKITHLKTYRFHSVDRNNQPIYHTNVMMSIGSNWVVICFDSIHDEEEKNFLENYWGVRKTIIKISYDQMEQFCANILELKSETTGRPVVVMSLTAFNAFTEEQKKIISCNGSMDIVHPDISTIECNGGGSARCMLAEIFLK